MVMVPDVLPVVSEPDQFEGGVWTTPFTDHPNSDEVKVLDPKFFILILTVSIPGPIGVTGEVMAETLASVIKTFVLKISISRKLAFDCCPEPAIRKEVILNLEVLILEKVIVLIHC
jgi:hypothetical protein